MMNHFLNYLALLLIITFVGIARAQDCQTLDCVECLESSECGHWQNENGCFEECKIADIPCYTLDTFPNLTVQETCTASANDEADMKLCAEQSTCSDCTTTTLSDGNSTCQWFTDEGFCASGCGLVGCGETTCTVGGEASCDGLDCVECLETQGCGSWQPQGGCFSECMIADASCFTNATFPDKNAEETCAASESQEADAKLCSAQKDCTSCVDTTLQSDNTTTCQWFPSGEYCASACGMDGCGEKACVSDDSCFIGDCTLCLESEENCAWAPEQGCLPSCDVIADAQCFPSSDYSADEVCYGENVASPPLPAPTSGGFVGGGMLSIVVVVITIAMVK